MNSRARIALVTTACILSSYAAAFQAPATKIDRDLEEAKTLYQEARFTDAIVRLLTTVDRLKLLEDLQGRKANLADAYLHLGLSYFALAELAPAKEQFKSVLRIDPRKRLDPQVYAPQVIALFEQARVELSLAIQPEPGPKPGPSPSAASSKKGGSKAVPLLLGVAGVGGIGVAIAGSRGPSDDGAASSSPAPSATPSAAAVVCPSLPGPNLSECSATGTRAALTLTVQNRCSSRTIQLFWVDYACQEIPYTSSITAPNRLGIQPTFSGHVWRLRDAQTREFLKEVVLGATDLVVTVP